MLAGCRPHAPLRSAWADGTRCTECLGRPAGMHAWIFFILDT